jgi:serine/threonine protein kinase
MYHWFYCQPNTQTGTTTESNVYMIHEVANYGTLTKWISHYRSTKEILSMTFQVFAGLLCMERQFGMIHGDLHADNILVMSSRERRETYIEYIIDGKSYYVPTKGYYFLIADFGRALIPDKIEIDHHLNVRNWYKEQLRLFGLEEYELNKLDWTKFTMSLKTVDIPFNKDTFLNNVAYYFDSIPEGYERSIVCNIDKRVDLPGDLQRFSM